MKIVIHYVVMVQGVVIVSRGADSGLRQMVGKTCQKRGRGIKERDENTFLPKVVCK